MQKMIRMQTANGEDGGLCVGEQEPKPTSWLSSLKHFFIDKWSGIGSSTSILIENYVKRSGDVQTAALLGVIA